MDFTQALDTSANDFEPPKVIPAGDYILQITKKHDHKVIGKDENWERVSFPCKIVEATENVDPDDLAEFGNVAGEPMSVAFMFPKDPDEQNSWNRTMEQLKRFLWKHLQLDVPEDAPLGEALGQIVGMQFIGTVTHRPDPNDSEVIYSEVRKTAPLD